jgi:molybdate-binding protein
MSAAFDVLLDKVLVTQEEINAKIQGYQTKSRETDKGRHN